MVKVEGDQMKGESKLQYEQTYIQYEQAAEDTLSREPMPREYQNIVKDYFDAIKPEMEKKSATADQVTADQRK